MIVRERPIDVQGRRFTLRVETTGHDRVTIAYDSEGEIELQVPGEVSDAVMVAAVDHGLRRFSQGQNAGQRQLPLTLLQQQRFSVAWHQINALGAELAASGQTERALLILEALNTLRRAALDEPAPSASASAPPAGRTDEATRRKLPACADCGESADADEAACRALLRAAGKGADGEVPL